MYIISFFTSSLITWCWLLCTSEKDI